MRKSRPVRCCQPILNAKGEQVGWACRSVSRIPQLTVFKYMKLWLAKKPPQEESFRVDFDAPGICKEAAQLELKHLRLAFEHHVKLQAQKAKLDIKIHRRGHESYFVVVGRKRSDQETAL